MKIPSLNPSIYFFRNYESSILRTRESLFEEMDNISSDFGNEARKILSLKLQSNNNSPLLGEIFPWIIKDLVDANKETTHEISVGWLAIYLYTLFLDEYVDNPKPLASTKFITGSLLAKTGLLKISRFTNNTPYESYIDEAFSFSAKNQQLDVDFQQQNTAILFKENYSAGKNYVVLACAGALAAQNSKHAEFITQFSETLLLTLQYLDDMADYKEDYNKRNFTVLLNDAFRNQPNFFNSFKSLTNRELLIELIGTGALHRAVEKVIVLLNQSILLINNNFHGSKSSSVEFFYTLQLHCSALNNSLKKYQLNFKSLPIRNQAVILDKIENQIIIIAQSS